MSNYFVRVTAMSDHQARWRCDVCGEDIKDPDDGYVIWKSNDQHKGHDFKIIHTGRCDKSSHLYSMSSALTDFLGERGLTVLLSMLSLGPIKAKLGQTGCQIADLDEFVDFMRRVQVPFYEEARSHFNDPSLLEDYSDANEVAPYLPEELKCISARYS